MTTASAFPLKRRSQPVKQKPIHRGDPVMSDSGLILTAIAGIFFLLFLVGHLLCLSPLMSGSE
jgi:hypothetical protein